MDHQTYRKGHHNLGNIFGIQLKYTKDMMLRQLARTMPRRMMTRSNMTSQVRNDSLTQSQKNSCTRFLFSTNAKNERRRFLIHAKTHRNSSPRIILRVMSTLRLMVIKQPLESQILLRMHLVMSCTLNFPR